MKFKKISMIPVLSFMCMAVIVGYINYEYNEEREANLGQSIYVVSKEGEVLEKNNNQNYVFNSIDTSSNFDYIKDKVKELKLNFGDINAENVKISYNFEKNKYILILPKELEVRNEEILSIISKYISKEKVEIKYE